MTKHGTCRICKLSGPLTSNGYHSDICYWCDDLTELDVFIGDNAFLGDVR